MFITKEEIKNELKDEECWKKGLSKNEKEMFLIYCTNGLDSLASFKDVYMREDVTRKVNFPGIKANEIVAKNAFQECLDLYGVLLKSVAPAKVNIQIFNVLYNQSFYSVFDFMDVNGEFLYKTIEEAKEILGEKAVAIESITTTMHPKDPTKLIRKVIFHSRSKAMKELSKYTKFIEEESTAGSGMGQVNLNTTLPAFDPKEDERRREEFKLV